MQLLHYHNLCHHKKTIFIVLFFIGAIILYIIDPVNCRLTPKCPIKFLTGLNCPGCGFQRSVHALLHGQLLTAISFNYWFVYAIPYALLFLIQRWFLKGKWKDFIGQIIENRYVVNFYIISFMTWFVIRNIYNI